MKIKQGDIGIGQNLKRLRLEKGYSQSSFTRELQLIGLNISYDIYKKMEQNKYNIRVKELLAIKKILKVEFNDFFEGLDYDDIIK